MKIKLLWCFIAVMIATQALIAGTKSTIKVLGDSGQVATVTVQDIATRNELANPNHLNVGQKLTIMDGWKSYTVQPGDNLTKISRLFNRIAVLAPTPEPIEYVRRDTIWTHDVQLVSRLALLENHRRNQGVIIGVMLVVIIALVVAVIYYGDRIGERVRQSRTEIGDLRYSLLDENDGVLSKLAKQAALETVTLLESDRQKLDKAKKASELLVTMIENRLPPGLQLTQVLPAIWAMDHRVTGIKDWTERQDIAAELQRFFDAQKVAADVIAETNLPAAPQDQAAKAAAVAGSDETDAERLPVDLSVLVSK